MKKITSILLIAVILCCSVLVFASCSDSHTHTYGAWSTNEAAGCESTGSRSKSCSCGDTVTETIDALGHNYVGGVCTDCGAAE